MKLLLTALLLMAPMMTAAQEPTFHERFGRGINLGNALEAPNEGDWGVKLEEGYFPIIAKAGFKHVRVPIRWSNHAGEESPYTIDPAFFARVDWVIDQARANGLSVIINMHHYDGIMKDPAAHRTRFVGLWSQIAPHYQTQPDSVAFELLNEPHDNLDAEAWNSILAETLTVIRTSNPTRTVVVGPAGWNNYQQLPKLKLPEGSSNLVATFHYYDPFHFTHQGAEWVGPAAKGWLGSEWKRTEAEQAAVRSAFDAAQTWAAKEGVELYLGEFGAYSKADEASRVRWTSFIAEEADKRKISSAYWEFCAGFGAYDPTAKAWRVPLLEALIPPKAE
ncbi:cellulase family glycosylhydrolase [bacterium]|nr:cellulase family glycosylhydrolase [bacterium]